VARFGGEEFLIALAAIGPQEARARCEVLRAQVAAYPWEQVAPGLAVTISLGLAPIGAAGNVAQAMAEADEHLYAAKRHGRNRVEPAA
jgi:diguanylate cyclase